ncbi:TPA: hypothetical protein U2C93_001589 [Streptococcus suis]|nr:hypothetical protein [Streptococcus suis]HEM6390779.1 hypothetical protein [Streptococcus suis]HEN0484740.1 hypothetical protein [Streptococcus suis]
MFEFKDGQFYYLLEGETKLIKLSDIGSKILVEGSVTNPMSYIPLFINLFFNMIVWLSKFLFGIFVKTYEFLGNGSDSVDSKVIEVINVNAAFFQTLFKTVAPYAFIALLLYALTMQVKRQGSALKIILLGFLTMGLIRGIYMPDSSGQTGVSRLYTSVSKIVDDVADSASKGLSNDSSTNAMATYFKNAMWLPYQGMNADLQDDGSFNLSDKALFDLLEFQDGDKVSDLKLDDKPMKDIAGTKDEPKVNNLWELGGKFPYVLIMLLETTVLGIVIVAFSIFGFFLKVLIIFAFYFLPILLVLSIFPFFSNMLFNTGKGLLSLTALSGMTGVFSSLFMMFNSALQDLFMAVFTNDIVLVFIFKAFVYWLIWLCRHQIIAFLVSRSMPQATRILNRFGDNGKAIVNNSLEIVKKPAMGSLLLANGALRTVGGKVKPGLERMKQGVSDTRFNKSVQRRMENGESFEVATLETAKGIEEKRIRRKQPMQTLSTMKHKTRALYHDLMEKGYVGLDSEKQAEHASKSLQSKNKLNELKVSKEGSRQKVNVLNQAIDKHVQKQEVPKPSGSDPIFVDFKKRGKVNSPLSSISTVGQNHKIVKDMPKEVEKTISQKINHSTLSRSSQVTQKPVNQSSLQTVIRKTPRVIRKPVQTETTEYQTTTVHEPITQKSVQNVVEKTSTVVKQPVVETVVQKSTSVVKDIRVEKQSEKIVDFRERSATVARPGNSKNVLNTTNERKPLWRRRNGN